MKKYPLATDSWDNAEIEAIQSVIQSGNYTIMQGDKVRKFESEFAKYTGAKYCVMVNSGSSANLLMVAAACFLKNNPLRAGDEVIVPAVSWSTTYYPVHQYGLKMVFVDIDKDTLNYDLTQLQSAITGKTRAIMAVNILGNPNDYNAINAMIKGKDIIILEDNCEAMAAVYEGKQTGRFGLMGTFSTYFCHHLMTMEGGLVITDSEECYHLLLSLRSHGWTRSFPNQPEYKTAFERFKNRFEFVLPGYNLRPIEMMGAIGSAQLHKLPQFIKNRRQNANRFNDIMAKYNDFIIQREIGESSWFGFSLIIKPESGRQLADVVNHLDKNGIETRPIIAGNFVRNPVIEYMDHSVHGPLTNADLVHYNGLFISNYQTIMGGEFDLLVDALKTL